MDPFPMSSFQQELIEVENQEHQNEYYQEEEDEETKAPAQTTKDQRDVFEDMYKSF